MKYAVSVLVVLVAFVSTCLALPETGKTEVGGNFWFRYHLDRIDESTQRSGFNVERGYLGLGHRWNSHISGQMTINVFTSLGESGLNGWDFELRDAYVNLAYIIPHGKVRVGLQKNYFGTVHDWKYLTVRRSLADAVGVVQERDYGVAFLGMVPGGMGEWALGVMNGEGFSSGLSPQYGDRQPGLMATLRLVPLRETVVGFSFLWDKRHVYPWAYVSDADPYGSSAPYETRTGFSFMGRLGSGPFSVLGEYLYYDYPIPDRDDPQVAANVKGTGFSIFPMMRLTEKFDLVGRYDFWDPDKDSETSIACMQRFEVGTGTGIYYFEAPMAWWLPADYSWEYYSVSHNVYTVGFNYNLTDRMEGGPGVVIQVNWQRMDPQEDLEWYDPATLETGEMALDAVDSFIFQLRWGWGALDF